MLYTVALSSTYFLLVLSAKAWTANAFKPGHGSGLAVFTSYPNLTACFEPPTYSCENVTAIKNTCCSPTPGGLLLQTQFWNTRTGLEDKGQLLPEGSWTIHGLWPDDCDGGFADQSYCDFSRQYDPDPSPATLEDGTVVPPYTGPAVDTFIKAFGRLDLLEYMNTYWINLDAPNVDFWAHEFSKHGTCISTFDVACYGSTYKAHADVVNFFDSVIRAFHQYPTFDMLAAVGILPSNKTGYAIEEIQNALIAQTGALPYIGCINGNILSEVYYYHHVLGTAQYGHYKTINTTSPTNCLSNETIWYFERTLGSERNVTGARQV
ncbi:hypothetical protein GYMLUDRAFT_235173 [Collybiopsis luxurians FD-317 M1]|nr:hypothetical protein GYMLUDRAFT_235173 [Collybiopsis luxurians FD-317 M1]